MSQQYLSTITENATRLGMRLQETLSERTRDLVPRGASSAYLESGEDKIVNVRRQLDSNNDRDKLDAMKRLVGLISKGRNVSEYFAQVVKNVASQNLEIRKLVYIYLLRYAEQEPDLALLSINTFQKDLADFNPLIRAMALRVLSGIKVPMISSILVLAIKKCSADMSPYVRKAAALAIPKCFELDSSHSDTLINIIVSLLRDRSSLPLGSAVVAFEAVSPSRLDVLHPLYRNLCRILADVDEWGQIELLNLLTRYARAMLLKPVVNNFDGEFVGVIDRDLILLLSSAEPLLQSRNPAVVFGVARLFLLVGSSSHLRKIIFPFLRLSKISREVELVTITYITIISRISPRLFSPFYSHFTIRTDDSRILKLSKVKVLLALLDAENWQPILRELSVYTLDADGSLVSASIDAIGCCARSIFDSGHQCLTALMSMVKSGNDVIVNSAVVVLKRLVQLHLSRSATPDSFFLSIIFSLATHLDDILHPEARACVVWLVGQYSIAQPGEAGPGLEGINPWAPDALRKLLKSFNKETSTVKLQILTLAAKLLVSCPSDRNLELIARYTFSAGRYDLDYDVRDRSRFLNSLLKGLMLSSDGMETSVDNGGVILRKEQVKMILFDGKAIHKEESPEDGGLSLQSINLVTGKPFEKAKVLPDWLEEGTDPSLRDSEDQTGGPGGGAITSEIALSTSLPTPTSQPLSSVPLRLDDFYADKVEDEDEREDEDEDEETDEGNISTEEMSSATTDSDSN